MNFLRKLVGGREAPPLEVTSPSDQARLLRLRDRIGASEALVPAPRPVPPPPAARFGPAAGPPPPPVVLARKPRERGRDWTGDDSWFGGLPRLGGALWPKGKDGRFLPFAAQISLGEIASACPESPLPKDGWLAFFLNDGAVVHVPAGDHDFTPPPDGLPLAYAEGGYPFPERESHTSRPLFPFWPVEPIGLPLPDDLRDYADEEGRDEIWEAQHRLLADRVSPREYAFSAYSARQAGIAEADMLWWFAAIHVGQTLRDALAGTESAIAEREKWIAQSQDYQSRLAAEQPVDEQKLALARASEQNSRDQIPEIRQQAAGLEAFLVDYDRFVAGREPWTEMAPEEVAELTRLMKQARDEFPRLATYQVPIRMDDVRDLCIRRMITGDEEALAALPESLLQFINGNYRLTTQAPHQMFGLGHEKQDDLYHHEDHLLLLQLSYDDLVEWRFGDMGIWHFWIAPEDAAAGRWDKAKLTFECA